MSQNWDFYFLHINDKPASILVDLDLIDDAPIEELSNMCSLRLNLQHPNATGFPEVEEQETLEEVECQLFETLAETALPVGRITRDGVRDFFFYADLDAAKWQEQVTAIMGRFPAYSFETTARADPEWEVYLEFLYPDELNMQRIQNHRVCRSLEEHGDKLDVSRDIDHWAVFESDKDRAQFIAKITGQDFEVSATTDPGEKEKGDDGEDVEEDNPYFVVQFFRADAPIDIDEVTLPLIEWAEEFNGTYDGWGAPIAGAEEEIGD